MKEFKMRASKASLLLTNGKDELKLGTTLISYLKKDYAEQVSGVKEEIHSKYLEKGVMCELEAIDVVAERFGYGILSKNLEYFEDEFFKGTPDIITNDCVIDTKVSWDYATFLDAVTSPINTDYEIQLQVYMHLTGLKKAKLVYVLLDTPEEANYGNEIIFSHMPIEQRVFSIDLEYEAELINKLSNKVLNCRAYLKQFDELIKNKLNIK